MLASFALESMMMGGGSDLANLTHELQALRAAVRPGDVPLPPDPAANSGAPT